MTSPASTFIERISIEKALYLNEVTYVDYKTIIGNKREYKNENERKEYYERMKALCTEVITHNGVVPRTYSYSKNMKTMGRQYSNGVQGIMREVRGFLMNHTSDIDMANAHPVILSYLCKKHNIPCVHLDHYIQNRDEILGSVPKLDRNGAKTLFLKAMNNDTKNKNCSHPFFRKFDCETKHIQKALSEIPEYKPIVDTIPDDKSYNQEGSKMNRILTVYEDKLLHVAIQTIQNKGMEVASLMFDGLMVYDDHYQNIELLREIETACETEFPGVGMKWDYKKHETPFSIPEGWVSKNLVNSVKESNHETSENSSHKVFARLVVEFEKTHAKILNKSCFVKETSEKTIIMTEKDLTTTYKHIECGVNRNGIPQSFISLWINYNDSIRKYDDVGIYPKGSLCPPNIYNLWRPFAMDLDTPYSPNSTGVEFILNHIKILCNNDDTVACFVLFWIAQMIQFPEVKSGIMPVFVGKQGTGKSSLVILLTKLLGAVKVLESSDPSRDIWGPFNGLMADSFLVHLCELSKKSFVESMGKVKNLLTDPTMTINNKGVKQITINSIHRFISTTNNEDCIPTEKGDRRLLICRCSDEKKGQKSYFDQLYGYMEDVSVLRGLFDYFKQIQGMDAFHKLPLPVTEFHADMMDMNRSPVESWLEEFTQQNSTKTDVELTSEAVYSEFQGWLGRTNTTYHVNKAQFMVRLKNLQIDGVETKHTKTGGKKVFNIPKLEVYFGLGNLPPEDDKDTVAETDEEDGDEVEYVEV
jgi:hypothetical protein